MAAQPNNIRPQHIDATRTPYAQRAHYHCGENGFAFRWPAVPARQFLAERKRAFDAAAPTGAIALDASDALLTNYPATTPLLLLRYLNIRAGAQLRCQYIASGEVYYVLSGEGSSRKGADTIEWRTGDLFCFPGGGETLHRAAGGDALLFAGTNEPLLAFERLQAPAPGDAVVQTTHWPAEEIERHLQGVYARPITPEAPSHFILFGSAALAPSTNTIASINVSINTIPPGGDQRPHHHNGVAVTLALQGEGVYSMIDGERCDWVTGAAQVTPPVAVHSHHARGTKQMRSLIFQDEALHYYTRTPGFAYDD
jgi:gentisate 1,2-dioxygenase